MVKKTLKKQSRIVSNIESDGNYSISDSYRMNSTS